ncbi:hypothetical protein, partial [Streptomyces bohaiensis]
KRIFGKKARAENPETGVPPSLQKNGRDNMGSRWAKGVLRSGAGGGGGVTPPHPGGRDRPPVRGR